MILSELYKNHTGYQELVKTLQSAGSSIIHTVGLKGSSPAVIAAHVMTEVPSLHIAILNEKEEASYFGSDIGTLTNENSVLFFPSSFKRPGQFSKPDQNALMQRAETLLKISEKLEKPTFVITYAEALAEKVLSPQNLTKTTLHIHTGEQISIEFIREVLQEYNFQRVDFVYEPGQYSVRGSIVDIFSFSSELPFRIDFFGDEVESIRTFDIETQLSQETLIKISIVPDLHAITTESRISFFEYLPKEAVMWIQNHQFISDKIEQIYNAVASDDKSEKLITNDVYEQSIRSFSCVEFGTSSGIKADHEIVFHTQPQPTFNKQFDLLADDLHVNTIKGFKNYILTDNQRQSERLSEIFKDLKKEAPFTPALQTLHEGFIDTDLKVCLYTDHQIFERYHKYKIKQNFKRSEAITISELNSLKPGDFVVHVDHGIGKFGGLEKITINGKHQEVIKLVYKDNDILYVSIHSLHRISKYRGKDGEPPKIYKLGSGAWSKLKENTKKKVKDIARDLIALYAKRMASPGFRFSGDSYLQQELEASFIYEDTPDQEKATRLVKQGMESEHPMDMLVCGDVGFGKTEVAIRAAFKAVTDNKQVAVLVPTTILALQHYNTFRERLKDFPCTVDYVSRFRTPGQQKEILLQTKEGKVDILIGTHRLLGKDLKFKDLGLLIIDEEQKFGVAAKEKLRAFKANVDSLTLTATPIPRTLQFSLMGARDLAIINTPPPNRHPIHTEIHTFESDIIKEAIEYELSRNGQVFFIHNRVQNILEVENMVHKLCPNAHVAVAHGQMEGEELEKIMIGFIAGDFDVLVATNIIESGLDIPNANTIIINNAQNFGLSDLHQLRGRVGRSNKRAFCYLIAPPMSALSGDARRRLQAIEDFSELGSGFHIAMQDLDIRGAGNLLGSEQSGFIAEMGYETYQRILNEAIQELKESEFRDLFFQAETEEKKKEMVSNTVFVTDCQIDTDLEVLFSEEYISNIPERTRLYKELDNISDEQGLAKFEQSLVDRFGPLPDQAKELLQVVRLRWKAIHLGIEKIIIKSSKMIAYFISNQMSPFYQSEIFLSIMKSIQQNNKFFKVKEAKDKLVLSADDVISIEKAIQLLEKLDPPKTK